MDELSMAKVSWLAATFVLAGLVKGVTGMGLPTVAMGLLGVILPPAAAAALLLIPSFVTNVWQWLSGAAAARLLRRLWTMMLGVAIGTLLSSALLVRADPRASAFGLGLALIAYAVYAWRSPAFALPSRLEPWLAPLVGIATGVVTGATGVFVLPAVPYLQSLRLDKDELVQALGMSFTVSTAALAAGLTTQGALHTDRLGASALALIPALAGMWLGQRIRGRIRAATFRRCFLLCLMLLGLQLAARPLF